MPQAHSTPFSTAFNYTYSVPNTHDKHEVVKILEILKCVNINLRFAEKT